MKTDANTIYFSAITRGFYVGLEAYIHLTAEVLQSMVVVSQERYTAIWVEMMQPNAQVEGDENGNPIVTFYEGVVGKLSEEEEAKKLLFETDQIILHALETGDAIPSGLRDARENARNVLNKGRL